MKHEIRAGTPAEVRADESTITVSGYAAVFNEETTIGDFFREVIKPGAFTEAVKNDDVVFLVNHAGLPLARTRSGTLKLTEDAKGLRIDSELDLSDPDVQRIKVKMERGDMDKMSFAFYPEVQEWDESSDTELPLRSITKASLVDVSIVNFPAYEASEIGLRSLQEHRSKNEINNDHSRLKKRMEMNLALRRIGEH